MTLELAPSEPLQREIERLRPQLRETEQVLRAIRTGEVDVLILCDCGSTVRGAWIGMKAGALSIGRPARSTCS